MRVHIVVPIYSGIADEPFVFLGSDPPEEIDPGAIAADQKVAELESDESFNENDDQIQVFYDVEVSRQQ